MKKILFASILVLLTLFVNATNYYVSPTGSDSNTGTIGSPWKSLTKASAVLAAKSTKGSGDTVFVRGGNYNGFPNNPANGYAQLLINGIQGTATSPCVFTNYPGESPLFDFSSVVVQAARPSPTALSIFASSYLKVKGLAFYGYNQIWDGTGVSRGVELNGCSNIVIEQCEVSSFQGTGFFISGGTNDVLYLNCDSHNNEDPFSDAISATSGTLVVGRVYKITNYVSGDNFSNVGTVIGGTMNTTGCDFICTGTTPTNWTHGSSIIYGFDAWDNADGFGITGSGNNANNITFQGCRAWLNCDDGWDNIFTNGVRTWLGCWAYDNGYYQRPGMPNKLPAGNGNGFKLGSTGTDALNISTQRVLKNCLSFDNGANGFDQNGIPTTGMTLYNCTAFRNSAYGFQFQYYPGSPATVAHLIKNCNALSNGSGYGNLASAIPSGVTNNSWQNGLIINNSDFQSVDSNGVSGPRQSDGLLPNLPYLKLVAGSDLVNAGVNVGLPFCQTAPDVNWFEYCPSSAPPVANAGSDQTITLPLNQATVSGSATTSGSISSWTWRAISFPSVPTISNPVAQTTTITNLVQGVYKIELKVVDNSGLSDLDTMQITVNGATPTAPTCSAGLTPITITLPTSTVALTGTGASTSGNTVSYLWTLQAGSGGTITSATSASTTATGLTAGSRTYRLTVTDNGNSLTCTSDKVVVTNPAATPPTANAGTDQTITLPTNNTVLTGSGTGGSGTITGYGWVKIQGGAATITTPTSQNPSITGMVQGIYKFELTVTASTGLTAKDTVQVVVLPAANVPPVANAGASQTITLPVTSATLSGSGTDTDGTITGYLWTQFSGASCTISNPSAPTTTVIGMTSTGNYIFQLTVTDNNGATGSDLTQVTVDPALATAPTCNAGTTPVVITLPVNTIALVGTGASTAGNTVSYLWTKITGTGSTIVSPSSASTTATGLTSGTYQYRLTVTDNGNSLTCTSNKNVTVNPALVVPTANAGANQTITLPTSSVSLSGSGTGGTINSYLWTKLSGVGGSFSAATSANTNFTGLVAGTYNVQLRVGNTDGNFGYDTVVITVNPAIVAPACFAGNDSSITLPTNSFSLTGVATGTGLSYLWTKLTGTGGTITNSTSLVATANGLVQDSFAYEFRVTDVASNVCRDTVSVVVYPIPVYFFTVNAGSDQQLYAVTTTTLTGIATSSYGTIDSYQWQQISGTASTITSPTTASTGITGLTNGTYQYSLTCSTSFGWIASDTVTVIVSPSNPLLGFKWYMATIINGKANIDFNYVGATSGTNFIIQKKSWWWFNDIATIAPIKNQNQYSYIDSKTSSGTSTYRIRYGSSYSGLFSVKKK